MKTNKAAALAKFLERKLQEPNGLASVDPKLVELAVKNAKETVKCSMNSHVNPFFILIFVFSLWLKFFKLVWLLFIGYSYESLVFLSELLLFYFWIFLGFMNLIVAMSYRVVSSESCCKCHYMKFHVNY